ncbi:MAG: 2-amino-4-hydroxy-6-hydroxymethyldihydropteridine diphosphokinase [Firmicutes bacterium]|nr:2-amino-4-hydroxy-6-hydroxymethyldihydropteridine diphosphokinase [Dethiobacter sp.]MBS3888947.1 2-amino-4-hydroxy-6-hydroxymethyldihydropteridine diphosphokinase [Bacillota bacterium]MBS4054287.1 2-amino-4-hydroxy-6-hydroxymethyldihydropteridine diphosphokinase [Thermaerobacter sp.]
MARVFLGLGGNLGDRQGELDAAIHRLAQNEAIKVVAVAKYIETEPVGVVEQGLFLNTVVEVSTSLAPLALLAVVEDIMRQAKRVRTLRFGPRTLDIDILLYDDLVLASPTLTIPHPRLREREFVLAPLVEVAPDLLVPPDFVPARVLLAILRGEEVSSCSL